jgi:hypothetical protein
MGSARPGRPGEETSWHCSRRPPCSISPACTFCIEDHAKARREGRCIKADVAEAVMVAAALRAGGGVTHGWKAMKGIAEDE